MASQLPDLVGESADLLDEIERMQLAAKEVATGAIAGLHRSKRRGTSIEFSEHKLYVPGDDVRHIDWRAFAKTDRFHVKQFEDETNMTLELLLDHSGSMGFSSRKELKTKLRYARDLIAGLSFLALRQGDALGLTTFAEEVTDELRPATRSSQLLEVFKRLVALKAEGPTQVTRCLDRFAQRARRRAMVIVFTDMFDPSGELALTFRRLKARGHDITVFHILDPAEIEFPYDAPTMFASMEDSRRLFVHPRTLRNSYVKAMHDFLDETQRNLTDAGIGYHLFRTDEAQTERLAYFLRSRSSGRG